MADDRVLDEMSNIEKISVGPYSMEISQSDGNVIYRMNSVTSDSDIISIKANSSVVIPHRISPTEENTFSPGVENKEFNPFRVVELYLDIKDKYPSKKFTYNLEYSLNDFVQNFEINIYLRGEDELVEGLEEEILRMSLFNLHNFIDTLGIIPQSKINIVCDQVDYTDVENLASTRGYKFDAESSPWLLNSTNEELEFAYLPLWGDEDGFTDLKGLFSALSHEQGHLLDLPYFNSANVRKSFIFEGYAMLAQGRGRYSKSLKGMYELFGTDLIIKDTFENYLGVEPSSIGEDGYFLGSDEKETYFANYELPSFFYNFMASKYGFESIVSFHLLITGYEPESFKDKSSGKYDYSKEPVLRNSQLSFIECINEIGETYGFNFNQLMESMQKEYGEYVVSMLENKSK